MPTLFLVAPTGMGPAERARQLASGTLVDLTLSGNNALTDRMGFAAATVARRVLSSAAPHHQPTNVAARVR